MGQPSDYGRYYWCVGLERKDVEVLVHADRTEVTPHGDLILWGNFKSKEDVPNPNLVFAAGTWRFLYAASVLDGHAVAVEHWPGQIDDEA